MIQSESSLPPVEFGQGAWKFTFHGEEHTFPFGNYEPLEALPPEFWAYLNAAGPLAKLRQKVGEPIGFSRRIFESLPLAQVAIEKIKGE